MRLKKWFGSGSKPKKTQDEIVISGVHIPITVYIEQRNGYRSSFTKKGINIRIPDCFTPVECEEVMTACKKWASKTIKLKPQLLNRYRKANFTEGQVISAFDNDYTIFITTENRKRIKTSIQGDKIIVKLPVHLPATDIEGKHISKAFANHYRDFLEKRLSFWNDLFAVEHQQLRLKYNSSNWGSCSSKGNINLSTRVLLCPLFVIDYVIVHELAHLIHQNHGEQFWNEVARVMPDYKVGEDWLKREGTFLDF